MPTNMHELAVTYGVHGNHSKLSHQIETVQSLACSSGFQIKGSSYHGFLQDTFMHVLIIMKGTAK
jgi:hypothetical protein